MTLTTPSSDEISSQGKHTSVPSNEDPPCSQEYHQSHYAEKENIGRDLAVSCPGEALGEELGYHLTPPLA